MMNGVFPAPMVVRGQGENASDKAENVIGVSGAEKGAVAAIMENNKDANDKGASKNGEWDGQPKGNLKGVIN